MVEGSETSIFITTRCCGVRGIVGGPVHQRSYRAVESRMARLAAVSTQVVEATTVLFGLCQTISSTRVNLHRNRTVRRMRGEVHPGSRVSIRRGFGGRGMGSVGRSRAINWRGTTLRRVSIVPRFLRIHRGVLVGTFLVPSGI